ncbi:MAG: ferritin-like domain-containing protein [Chthoniobacterales bacterium]
MDKVPEIVAELQICYATEIEMIQNYLANAIDLEGSRAEPIKALFDDEVQTALTHARRLAKRIKALEGRIPGSVELPGVHKGLLPPADPTNLDSALLRAIKSEDVAIAQYERVIQLCDGHDFVTLDLVIELLVDERERRQRLVALLQGTEMDPSPGR